MAEVNQQAIAERLNLSRATVSRCFTNHPGINPVTRARVFQVAAELGYSHLETRTRTTTKPPQRRETTFGVLICSDEEEYRRTDYQNPGEQILAGVTERAQLAGAKLDVHLMDPSATTLLDPSYMKIARLRRRWSGILLVYPFPDLVLDELAKLRPVMPIVSLVEQFDHSGIDCVDVDHYKGISAAIEHLVALGHRRIGFFTRRYQVEASWSFRRYAAFAEKMVRLRLPVSSDDVINVFPARPMDDEESVSYAAERTRDGVTAWVCAADHQAYDLIRGLGKCRIKVPKSVSVTGFDGIDRPADAPELATIQIPFREIGSTGTQRLVERIRKRFGSAHHVLIDCPFKAGATVGPPPAVKNR